jgi:hypothetical protein
MLKRVSGTRFCAWAILLSLFFGTGGVLSPVSARVDISIGQAGDPTDGEGVTDSGGSSVEPANLTRSGFDSERFSRWIPKELVLFVNGVQYRIDLRFLMTNWKIQ